MALKMACNYILVSKQLQKRLNMRKKRKKNTKNAVIVGGSCLASLIHVHMENIKHHIYS